MEKTLRASKFQLGACYYPEQWPDTLWEDDFRRMREMGLGIIRVAEFAWSVFEPEEGLFQFDLFDRVMDLAAAYGLSVIIGTPTATPPAWLTHKYPEVLNASKNGIVYQHGERQHNNYSSQIYRDFSARIAGKLAEHYANHNALAGWQIDNELNCGISEFYSAADQTGFRTWLQNRYGTLDRLNAAWGAAFWNQTYSHWDQVHLTSPTPSNSPNPHQALDEKRFISDTVISYVKVQVDAIREFDSEHWITTNGLFGHLDSHRLTQENLDFFSYDSYPQFATLWPDGGEHPLLDRKWGASLSVTRGISPQFCVMEQQSGPGGWVNNLAQPTPKPGQIRLWTYQSIAHGADMLLYFRWRTATFGTEIYWHGINDYHNRPNRRCAEVAQIGSELGQIGDALVGSRYIAEVAILKDYNNDWDGELDIWHGPYEKQSAASWFAALQHRHVPVDIQYLSAEANVDDLRRYHTLIYPHPTIMTDETAEILNEYVRGGGRLVLGCRTGYKNIDGHCVMRPFPGPVSELCGVEVDEFTRIGPLEIEPSIQWHGQTARTISSGPFNDILRPTTHTARVLAAYGDEAGHYAGAPALVENRHGSGLTLYYGGVFTVPMAHATADHLGLTCPFADLVTLPRDIELAARRRADGQQIVFLLNYSSTPQPISVHTDSVDLLSGSKINGEHIIPPYGVIALETAPVTTLIRDKPLMTAR